MSGSPLARMIVIDGPSGSGKTTVARGLARQLQGTVLDTGALYRAVALESRKRGIAWSDEGGVGELAGEIVLEFRLPADGSFQQEVWLNGDDVTKEIRANEISEGASQVSALPKVRSALLGLQRKIAESAVRGGVSCVAEGRDMGTVVFPNADLKFFLTASLDERASRRTLELERRTPGEAPPKGQVRDELERRDERDSGREVAPLRPAADAIMIDSSDLEIEAVIKKMSAYL